MAEPESSSPPLSSAATASSTSATQLGAFDYVIVGAGPSAVGLVYGLLTQESSQSSPSLSIAWIERGAADEDKEKNDAEDLTVPLNRWFAASHNPACRKTSITTGYLKISSTDTSSSPKLQWQRLVDVPVGVGLGGSSLINAGLVIPPASSDVDFADWPRSIATKLSSSVSTILDTMHTNQCLLSSTSTASSTKNSPPTSSSIFTTTSLPIVNNTNLRKEDGTSATTSTSKATALWKEIEFPSCCLNVPCAARYKPDSGMSKSSSSSSGDVERASYYDSLVRPLFDQNPKLLAEQLTLLTGYTAERLLFTPCNDSTAGVGGMKCTGVEVVCAVTGRRMEISATKEVIVCAGAIESPALLLASGIGRRADLQAIGVPSIYTATTTGSTISNSSNASLAKGATTTAEPFVGGNIRDHVLVPRIFLTKPNWEPLALNGVRAVANLLLVSKEEQPSEKTNKPTTKAQIGLMDAAAYPDLVPRLVAATLRFRLVASADNDQRIGHVIKYVNAVLNLLYGFVELLLYLLIVYTPLYYLLRYCIVTMAVFVMNGESVGTLRVTRRNIKVDSDTTCRRSDLQVEVELNYLQSDNDVRRMMDAWEAGTALAFPKVGVDIFPGPLVRQWSRSSSPSEWPLHHGLFAAFARAMVRPYFHWMGTCAMQTTTDTSSTTDSKRSNESSDDWVVDENFAVRNVASLRVCDASVMPSLISSPPALTCAALGHILALKLLKGK